MSYASVKDFQRGLDARKFKLSLPPGTLTKLVNAHINQGAEVEKRKAFVPYILPPLLYGAQETTSNIVVFGNRRTQWTIIGFILVNTGQISLGVSVNGLTGAGAAFDLPAGGLVTLTGTGVSNLDGTYTITSYNPSSGILVCGNTTAANGGYAAAGTANMALPSPIVYQPLVHPLPNVTMTGVTSSAYFDGQTLAVTTWSDGDTLVYYGSALVRDFYVGEQGNLEATPFAMANDLCDSATATGNYTAVKPVLSNLYFQVTGGSVGAGNAIGYLYYYFGRLVQITPNLMTNYALLAVSVPFTTDQPTTAAAIRTAIAAATDGSGNNLGFTASAADVGTNKVTIIPPATDANGAPLGVAPTDALVVTPTGNVIVYVPTISATFQIASVPTQASAKPFSVQEVLNNVNLTNKLISTGTAATAGANAVGQFTIFGGSPNTAATATITQSGQPTAGQNVIVGGTTYKFVSVLTGANNEVLIGASAAATLANLANAINASAGAGVVYGYYTAANTQASAVLTSATVITLTSSVGGTPGNAVTLTATASNYALVGFAGGGPNTNGISQVSVGGTNLLSGAVQFNATPAQTANDLVAAINNFSGTSGFTATANGSVVSIIPAATGTTYNGATVIVTSTGNVVTANCHFVINIANGQTITTIAVASVANILTATMTYQDAGHPNETVVQFLGRVSANINANTGVSGYLSWVDTTNVAIWIGAAVNSSADPTSTITVSGTVSSVGGSTNPVLQVGQNFTNSPLPLTVNFNEYDGSSPISMIVTPTGGFGPYTYNWKILSSSFSAPNSPSSYPSVLSLVFASNGANTVSGGSNSQSLLVRLNTGTAGQPISGGTGIITVQCTVVDSSTPTPQSVTATFNYVVTF